MAKIKWNDVVDRAIAAFKSCNYVYLYGAKNVKLTSEEQIRNYFAAEPAYFKRYTEAEKKQIIKNSLGKIAIDCSGFTGWVCTGDKQYSIGQINNCSKYNTLAGGPTGSLLFTTWGGAGRHIGLDVGCGLAMHIGWESTDKAIKEGRAGILFEPITTRAWEKSGESNVVDYAGAYSPYPPTAELWAAIHGEPSPSPAFEGWVGEAYGASIIPVYKSPTGTAKLSAWKALAPGNLFEVISSAGTRWLIKIANKHMGYIDKQYCLRKTPYKTGTISEGLWLRQNAGKGFKGITVIPKGATVQICDQKPAADGRPWDYVIFGTTYGFCSDKYINKG